MCTIFPSCSSAQIHSADASVSVSLSETLRNFILSLVFESVFVCPLCAPTRGTDASPRNSRTRILWQYPDALFLLKSWFAQFQSRVLPLEPHLGWSDPPFWSRGPHASQRWGPFMSLLQIFSSRTH
eukprot:TRINITY_DN14110_c0_g1_i1.p1 TRINITY_DN14110_c0_g1~~TRINITY_DN14110_c0_g1_i1.p1  ORF type:complete len:126 (+),score=9.05 TRINITY_DN14110_c0_g1_i1:604-981(+)